MNAVKRLELNPRGYTKPTVVYVDFGRGVFRYTVCGTDYGYIHTTAGDMRTWKSYSGARRALLRYVPF